MEGVAVGGERERVPFSLVGIKSLERKWEARLRKPWSVRGRRSCSSDTGRKRWLCCARMCLPSTDLMLFLSEGSNPFAPFSISILLHRLNPNQPQVSARCAKKLAHGWWGRWWEFNRAGKAFFSPHCPLLLAWCSLLGPLFHGSV